MLRCQVSVHYIGRVQELQRLCRTTTDQLEQVLIKLTRSTLTRNRRTEVGLAITLKRVNKFLKVDVEALLHNEEAIQHRRLIHVEFVAFFFP